MAPSRNIVALLLLTSIFQSHVAAQSRTAGALLTYTVTQGNLVKTFSMAAYDTKDKPTVTTQVTIDNVPATVVIGPYKNVHMITAAAKVKRDPDNIGDHGEPDSDAPGSEPSAPSTCTSNTDAPVPEPTPVPSSLISSTSSTTSTSTTSATPAPITPSAPYAQGVCSFHLTEWYYGDVKDSEPFGLEILMKDAVGTQIGWQVHTAADATSPLMVKSKLEDVFVITPEEQHSYIQYTLGSQSWPSNGNFQNGQVPRCTVGDYDASDYPAVSRQTLSICDVAC